MPVATPLRTSWGDLAGPRLRGLLVDGLPVPPSHDRRTWDRLAPAVVGAVGAAAEAERGTPWPQPLATQYARVWRDGDRTVYEAQVFARERRLARATLMAAALGDPAWVDEVADGVQLFCEQSSWCWPAHDHDAHRRGDVVPAATDAVLDLGAGEVAGALAWVDHLLGDRLDDRVPGLRRRVRHEVRRRVLDPFVRRTDWGWLTPPLSNWTAWIHTNVLTAALALLDDPGERADVVARVAGGIDDYLGSLPPDGAIDEGYGYWWAGAARALEALTLLEHATGGWLDASAVPVVRALVDYPHRVQLGDRWYLAVADGVARPSPAQPWHVLHAWAVRTGADEAAAHAAASHARADDGALGEHSTLARAVQAATYTGWPESTPGVPLVADAWWDSTQVALARTRAGEATGLTLTVKGGHNDESHNHDDVGSVTVAVDGVPVVVDPGRPTYDAGTFGPHRYDRWTMQSSWHSVPTVRGAQQPPGRQFRARDVSRTVGVSTEVRLDLADAYPAGLLDRWTRTATLDRGAGRVVVSDEWVLGRRGSAEPTVVHYVLAGDVDLAGPGRVVVHPLDGAPATLLTWEPDRAEAVLTRRDLDDPMLGDVWGSHLTRLDLHPDDRSGHGRLDVTVEVLG